MKVAATITFYMFKTPVLLAYYLDVLIRSNFGSNGDPIISVYGVTLPSEAVLVAWHTNDYSPILHFGSLGTL